MDIRTRVIVLSFVLGVLAAPTFANSPVPPALDTLLTHLRRQLDDVSDHPFLGGKRHTIRYDLKPLIGVKKAYLETRLGRQFICDEGDGKGGLTCAYFFYSLNSGANAHDEALADKSGWVLCIEYQSRVVKNAYWRHDE